MTSGGIPTGCRCSPQRACATSPRSSPKVARPARTSSLACSNPRLALACRRHARRLRATSIPIATPGFGISTTRSARQWRLGSRRSVSTPRRRSCSANSRTPAANGIPQATRRGSTRTTSRAWRLGRRSLRGLRHRGRLSDGFRWDRPRQTARFSVAAIRAWRDQLGSDRYPEARNLTITADCGGSNGNRTRLRKTELQKLSDHAGLQITVCHFPPGTSKWNKIEHRLLSFIARNWRRQHLISYEVIINLIAATTTSTGLEVYARLDQRLPQDRGHRCRTGRSQPHPRRVPRRAELLDQPLAILLIARLASEIGCSSLDRDERHGCTAIKLESASAHASSRMQDRRRT